MGTADDDRLDQMHQEKGFVFVTMIDEHLTEANVCVVFSWVGRKTAILRYSVRDSWNVLQYACEVARQLLGRLAWNQDEWIPTSTNRAKSLVDAQRNA